MPHVFPQIMPRPQLRFAAASFEQCQILSCHDLRSDRGGESGWCNGSDFAANYRQLALWSAECAGDFGCGCCCHKYFWREDCGDSRIGRTCAGNSSGRFAWVAAFEKETRSQESSVFQKSEPVVVQGSQTAFEQGRWTTWFGFPKAILPSDIRRSVQGRKAIKDILIKIASLDNLHYASKPAFDPQTQKCLVKDVNADYLFNEFLLHAPMYFQFKYFKVRNVDLYGNKVCQELQAILDELKNHEPRRKLWLALVKDVYAARLQGSIQTWFFFSQAKSASVIQREWSLG